MPSRIVVRSLSAAVLSFLAAAGAAADSAKTSTTDFNFGSRTDKPDGSSALTIGRRLPTEWDTKVGTDVSLAAPMSAVPSDNIARGIGTERSSGAVWGSLTMPGIGPLGFDKTSIDARLDAGSDQGKLGATLSRSMPLNQNFSITLQNSYSVTQSLASGAAAVPVSPFFGSTTPEAVPTTAGPNWSTGESVQLSINPSGTRLSAGASSSMSDLQWHNKFSVEQDLFGPLKLTTSVENAGTSASNKSFGAAFKRQW